MKSFKEVLEQKRKDLGDDSWLFGAKLESADPQYSPIKMKQLASSIYAISNAIIDCFTKSEGKDFADDKIALFNVEENDEFDLCGTYGPNNYVNVEDEKLHSVLFNAKITDDGLKMKIVLVGQKELNIEDKNNKENKQVKKSATAMTNEVLVTNEGKISKIIMMQKHENQFYVGADYSDACGETFNYRDYEDGEVEDEELEFLKNRKFDEYEELDELVSSKLKKQNQR